MDREASLLQETRSAGARTLQYGTTIFLSAFLLFQVEPLLAKFILPWFGGSAGVWAVALTFFQVVLLLGYAYAHSANRFLGARGQAWAHSLLLLASCALLPILPSPAWRPAPGADPTGRILLLLAATIGLPYFLLSATTPLLQAWYVRRTGSGMPYRFFALSNAGSLLALLSYPFLVEPLLSSRWQAWIWSAGYLAFAGLAAWTGWTSTATAPSRGVIAALGPAASQAPTPVAAPVPGIGATLRWITLAACPSALLMAVANHLSANVAPIPLLWVLPLALYLATFILAFEWPGCYRRGWALPLLFLALGAMAALMYWDAVYLDLRWTLPGFLLGLFCCALFCHGELARRRPDPAHLTQFYLAVALGGALGGGLVALAAPHWFSSDLELPLGLAACAVLGLGVVWRQPEAEAGGRRLLMRCGAGAAVLALAGTFACRESARDPLRRFRARNFYGTLEVKDDPADVADPLRTLTHGIIEHGAQHLEPGRSQVPTSYYGETSGVGRAIRALQARGPVRLGVVGLGAGCLSAYGRPGDALRIYEINPLVLRIAREQFSYLRDCPAPAEVVLGDARLSLEGEPDQAFDLLAVDAFSGDAIPVHLLTVEAFRTYFRHLKPGGVLALHLSNRYLDLAPVGAAGAARFQRSAWMVLDPGDEDQGVNPTDWMLVARTGELLADRTFQDAEVRPVPERPGFRPWTDDYSNLFRILRR
jgi:hypothetical protein